MGRIDPYEWEPHSEGLLFYNLKVGERLWYSLHFKTPGGTKHARGFYIFEEAVTSMKDLIKKYPAIPIEFQQTVVQVRE